MNESALTRFNASLSATRERSGDQFDLEFVVADDGADAKTVARRVLEKLLPRFRANVDRKIAFVEREAVAAFMNGRGFVPWSDEARALIEGAAHSELRSSVEELDDVVQLVASGLVTSPSRVFLFERDRKDLRYETYGRGTILQGPHVAFEGDTSLTIAHVQRCLTERFAEDLHLAQFDGRADPIGMVWDPEVGRGRHVGIVLPIEIRSAETARDLHQKKFRTRGRRPPQLCRFVDYDDLRRRQEEFALEAWSRAILASGWLAR